MREISVAANDLVTRLLGQTTGGEISILDSCGVSHSGSRYLIAGILPAETFWLNGQGATATLQALDDILQRDDRAAIFTLSYEFGRQIVGLERAEETSEPDVYVQLFDSLIIHDYLTGTTWLAGDISAFDRTAACIEGDFVRPVGTPQRAGNARSSFSRESYIDTIAVIKERIRRGDTYQTNLTRKITADLSAGTTPEAVFESIRRDHPAPFAAFIRRGGSTVISASPERLALVSGTNIATSPIKGTALRTGDAALDEVLKQGLLNSEKDRAENIMITDLLRNDIGRVCEFGSVAVDELCVLHEHPSLYHLVSTVSGRLRPQTRYSEILRAIFPCGSITGAPKISTMRIIDEVEPFGRGLSMGAIGYRLPPSFGMFERMDVNVAIRTMVVENSVATFNVGGGIVIDSDPEAEFEETRIKAAALLRAIGCSDE